MPRLPGLRRLFRLPDTAERARRDVDDEIAWHLEQVTSELEATGLSREDARRRAEQQFGDVEGHRRALHAAGSGHVTRQRSRDVLVELASDIRYAIRGLRRDPVFAIGAIVTLALGLAANATMFGVVDRLLLRPPPHVRDSKDLSLVYFRSPRGSSTWWTQSGTSYPAFATLRDSSGMAARAAAWWITEGSLDRGTAASKVRVGLATGDFFSILGTRPALGRWFGPAEDTPATTELPAVISHALWQGRFAGDPSIAGRTLRVDQRTYTIVGVAPAGFNGPVLRPVDLWVPMRAVARDYLGAEFETSQNFYWLKVIVERKPGLSLADAETRATRSHQLAARAAHKGDSIAQVVLGSVVPARGAGVGRAARGVTEQGQAGLTAEAQVAAWLAGVAAIVLLVVCANLANLLLSRASRRRRETAVRLAMGVRRSRLVRQFLAETCLLAVAGGAAGLAFTWWGGALMRRTLLSQLAWDGATVDGRVLLFTLGACVVAVLVSGVAPALVASGQDLAASLRGSTQGGGHRRTRLQRTLLVAQAALSVVLLTGAGLFVRSLRNVADLHLGYDAGRVLVANVDLSGSTIFAGAQDDRARDAEVNRFWREAEQEVRRLPGVASAAVAVTTPFASSWATEFHLPGRDSLPELGGDGPYVNAVGPDYLETMGTRLVRGRGFTAADARSAELVGIVNEVMAARLWPGESALGRCMKVGADTAPCTTVIGVMENAFRDNLRESETPQYLVLLDQPTWHETSMRSLFVRVTGDPARTTALVRERLQGLRPDLPYADVTTLSAIIEPEMQSWRLGAAMFGLFGAVALLVAAVGLYAVVAYDVSQRQHELGVRAALGARPRHLLGLVVRDGVMHAVVGVVAGILVAWGVGPLAGDMLFRVPPRDAGTYAVVAGVLLLAAIVASALPGRQASRVAPADVLRAD